MTRLFRAAIPFVLAVVLAGCTTPASAPRLPIDWSPIDSLNQRLPDGVAAFAGVNDTLPLRAWYVRVTERNSAVETRVIVADDSSDNRRTATDIARRSGACVVLNGGYFAMRAVPAYHAGLLAIDGAVLAPPTRTVTRRDTSYAVARAAIGFDGRGGMDIGWISERNGRLYEWPSLPPHRPGRPAPAPDSAEWREWPMRDALAAGPLLVTNGRMAIATNGEVFFGSSIPQVHPRSAIGYTRDGDLLLLVVDGRQEASRGVDLAELASLMLDLGAVEAMNLDGGGSSTLVVDGVRLNLPGGLPLERQVMSAVAVFCDSAASSH